MGKKADFLQEVFYHQLFSEGDLIVKCYGISQDLETKNYVMVMNYMEGGNLRQYLKNNSNELYLENKFNHLMGIANQLTSIHEKGLVHYDFHPGNILNNDVGYDYW